MMKKEVTRKTFFVLEVAFLYGLLANLGHPVTPAYLSVLNLSSSFGYFLAAMNVGILLTAPLWGSFGDTKNRKIMVAIGFIIYAIGQLLFGVFNTTNTIIIARLISGVGNGAITVNMLSYISKSKILKERRKEVTSSYIVFNVLGTSVGSALGGIIGGAFSNYSNVFYIQAGLLLLFGIILLFIHSTKDEVKTEARSKNPFASLKDIKKINSFYLLFLSAILMIAICFSNVTKYLDKYFDDTGHSPLFLGNFNVIVGIVTLIASLLLLPQINKKLDSYKGSIIFCLIAAISVFLSFNLPNMIGIFSFYFIYIIAKTILEPLTVSILSNNDKIPVGILMGVRQSIISLGAIIGMIVAGYIYDYSSILLFNICSLLFVISALILFSIKNMKGR